MNMLVIIDIVCVLVNIYPLTLSFSNQFTFSSISVQTLFGNCSQQKYVTKLDVPTHLNALTNTNKFLLYINFSGFVRERDHIL